MHLIELYAMHRNQLCLMIRLIQKLSLAFLLLVVFGVNGIAAEKTPTNSTSNYKINEKRSFKSLDLKLDAFDALPAVEYFSEELYSEPSENELEAREKIEATYNKVLAENRFVKFLDQSALLELPVGIKSEIGALSYTILIDSLIATPNTTYLYASMLFEAPKVGKIHFRGADIVFSKEGGIVNGRLELVGKYQITDESAKTQFIITGDNRGTYAAFDCSGFTEFGLDASLLFSNTLVKPENQHGDVIEN